MTEKSQKIDDERTDQFLNTLQRSSWLVRLVLFLAIILSLFAPWYETEFGGIGNGWIYGIEWTGWTLGLCALPYLALVATGILAILGYKNKYIVWAYRFVLLIWLIFVIFTSLDPPIYYWGAWSFLWLLTVAAMAEFIGFLLDSKTSKDKAGYGETKERRSILNFALRLTSFIPFLAFLVLFRATIGAISELEIDFGNDDSIKDAEIRRENSYSYDIWSMDVTSGEITNLTQNPAMDREANSSPDGSHILFVSKRDGHQDIYSMSFDGGEPKNLTDDPWSYRSSEWEPTWSPDGEKIAFVSGGRILIMNSDGNGVISLTRGISEDSSPDWSPDGSKIAFSTFRDGNSEIYIMNSDGSDQINLTNSSAHEHSPCWSPDGQYIAFESGSQIHLMSTNGDGDPIRLNSRRGYAPDWSLDGEHIVFSCSGEICVMNADGKDLQQLTTGSKNEILDPNWSPDGKHILFTSIDD